AMVMICRNCGLQADGDREMPCPRCHQLIRTEAFEAGRLTGRRIGLAIRVFLSLGIEVLVITILSIAGLYIWTPLGKFVIILGTLRLAFVLRRIYLIWRVSRRAISTYPSRSN